MASIRLTRSAPRLARAWWASLVLVLFALPLFAGLGRRDMQNDESIYSYAVESILESGDWLNPRSSPDPNAIFLEKPPLKFWIVALPIRLGLMPDDEFGLRFWDAVFGSVIFLYVFAIGRRLAGPLCGVSAALWLFGFSPLIFEHGFRSNNMEAALVLAYCGGVYHFLRWAETADHRAERRHALAAAAFCFLGFMTKFVAVGFLPLVLLAATALLAPARRKLLGNWRLWLAVTAIALAAAAPWFVYQTLHRERGVWTIMLGEHVMRRMSSSLDPAHLQPWHYYFTYLYQWLNREGGVLIACVGALLLVVRTVRTRWLDGLVVLLWFALPLPLISFGTSKLGHYLYPYVPPVALAAGYSLGWVLQEAFRLLDHHWPAWSAHLVAAGGKLRAWQRLSGSWAAVRTRASRLVARQPGRGLAAGLRVLLLAAASLCLVLAAVVLVHEGRVSLGGYTVARSSRLWYLVFYALAAATLVGYGRAALKAALPIALLALTPLTVYKQTLPGLMMEKHPLRDARACLAAVRDEEGRAGRRLPPVYAYVPNDFIHSYFFYLRSAGWEWKTSLSTAQLEEMVGPKPRPVLLGRGSYEELWRPFAHGSAKAPPRVPLDNVLLLVSGPYARCGTD